MLLFPWPASPADLSAKDILYKSLHLDGNRSVRSEITIQVVENEKEVRTREMSYRRKVLSGLDRVRIEFLAPPDVKGMALLILDRPNGGTDQHLYTPALRRVRRIRGSLKSQEFADTDFSYEDMERRKLDDADHDLEREETINDRLCYKIISTTKKGVRSQYGKTVAWIDKETFLLHLMDLYARDGRKIKTLQSEKAEQIQGIWTQIRMEMKNTTSNRKTLYEASRVEYDVPLDENLFQTSALGQ